MSKLTTSSEILAAMANAKRLEILMLIAEREWSVSDLKDKVRLSQSALSQHLAKLRAARLVTTRRQSRAVFYSCKAKPVIQTLEILNLVANPYAPSPIKPLKHRWPWEPVADFVVTDHEEPACEH